MTYQLMISEKTQSNLYFFQHPLLPKLGKVHGDLS